MVVNFIRKCCWLLGSQLSVGQYNAIAIAIVDSRFGCICCGVPVVVLGGKDHLHYHGQLEAICPSIVLFF